MDRAERRRRERASRKAPGVTVGDNIVVAGLGHQYEPKPLATMPEKIPGKHRWVAMGSWVLNDEQVAKEFSGEFDAPSILDQENLYFVSIGCWDCEQALGTQPGQVSPDSVCLARGD